MPTITFKDAQRRYLKAFIPIMIFYGVFCFVGPLLLLGMVEPPRWMVSLIAIITALPIVGVFWLIGRLLRETDEYTRKIQMDAILSGGAITLSVTVIWGFLELYKAIPSTEYSYAMMLVAPLFFGMWGLAYAFQARYRK